MRLPDLTYHGPDPDDMGLQEALPSEVAAVLVETNGFVAYRGGFHFRGVTRIPTWHSLSFAWRLGKPIHKLYAAVQESDIPFGQNLLGDQFLWRDDVVFELNGETGELTTLRLDLADFLTSLRDDPERFLPLQLLRQFEADGSRLQPGQLLNVYPPLCSAEASAGVSLRAVPAVEQIGFLASLAAQIRDSRDGSRLRIVPEWTN
jgi:hypothetical protein